MVLAFDTAAAHVAAAVLSGDRLVTRVAPMATGQAEALVPLLSALLADQGLDWRDLGLIAVGTGPGNFTGIRIAVACARGLALGLGIPAIGVTGFDALRDGTSDTAVIEAPRGMAYVQAPASDPCLIPAAEAAALPGPQRRLSEIGAEAHVAAIARIGLSRHGTPQPRPAPLYVRPPDAAPARDPAPLMLP